ncbi:MAG: cell division protein PerM [Nocardioides sp.]
MTSLLSAPVRPGTSAASVVDPRHRRPLALVAALGGVLTAGALLTVCLGVAVIGWFLTDAASHGAPRDALQVGALGWLMAHGSGIRVQGTVVTAVPLLLTLLAGWSCWRVGHRVGSSVSGHGPDADQISDGERDWTVPLAISCFALGYVAVTLLTASLASTPRTAPSTGSAVGWSLLLAVAVGGPAIAIGSGRAAIWAAMLPGNLRATAASCSSVLRMVLLASLVAFVASFLFDVTTAVNVLSGLRLDTGEVVLFVVLSLLVVPNATIFSASYLLGPGFTVGAQTLVSPTLVTTGALPAFPILAALPDSGPVPSWTIGLIGIPPLAAALGAALAQRRRPTVRWEEGALRGCAGGVVAGVVLGWLAGLAGGAVGPGRMRFVEPLTSDVLVHAVTALGLGGLVGGVVMTWWQRRTLRRTA